MAQKLYDDASVSAVAQTIRSIDGDDTPMKVADMPARIQNLVTHAITNDYGIVKLANAGEAADKTDDKNVITPATMAAVCQPNVIAGLVQFINDSQDGTISDDTLPEELAPLLSAAINAVTPLATASTAGKVTLATVDGRVNALVPTATESTAGKITLETVRAQANSAIPFTSGSGWIKLGRVIIQFGSVKTQDVASGTLHTHIVTFPVSASIVSFMAIPWVDGHQRLVWGISAGENGAYKINYQRFDQAAFVPMTFKWLALGYV